MLVYFGFTHCPDVCPEELDKISAVMRILQGMATQATLQHLRCTAAAPHVKDHALTFSSPLYPAEKSESLSKRVLPLFITVDSKRDTVEIIRDYLKGFRIGLGESFGLHPPCTLLTLACCAPQTFTNRFWD